MQDRQPVQDSQPVQDRESNFDALIQRVDRYLEENKYLSILESISKIGILIAFISFVLSVSSKRQQEVFLSWDIITSSDQQSGSGGRVQALQTLHSRPWVFPWIGRSKEELWHPVKVSNGDPESIVCDEITLWGFRLQPEVLDGFQAIVPNPPNHVDSYDYEDAGYGANLENLVLCGANLRRTYLTGANLSSAQLDGSQLQQSLLDHTILSNASITNANMRNTLIDYSNMENINLSNSTLEGASIVGSYLNSAILVNTNFKSADLTESNLIGAHLIGARLVRADLSNVHAEKAILTDADIRRANLTNADFRGAQIGGTLARDDFFYDACLCDTLLPSGALERRDCGSIITCSTAN